MRSDFLHLHYELSRRQALRLGAAGAAAVGLVTTGSGSGVAAAGNDRSGAGQDDGSRFDDTMFDVAAVRAGAWVPGPYGPGDQRGTLNELTPQHTASALALLRRDRPVKTYQLGQRMFNGFPAFPVNPPRVHEMHLLIDGYQPPAGFVEGGGIVASTTPRGPNQVVAHEERWAANYTFQIGTQVDSLGHIGVGDIFYNGFRGADLASPTGLRALGTEATGPIVTRAVIYDVVGLKVAEGASGDLSTAPDGTPILRDGYRITWQDLTRCLDRQRVRGVGRGDIPVIHTGWSQLAAQDPTRYLSGEPGIYLAEARAFAARRVALVAADNWALELVSAQVPGGNVFACHQELIVKHGVRIGEGFVPDAAIADNVFEGVIVITPQNVPGATAGSTPPVLLGQPGRPPRS